MHPANANADRRVHERVRLSIPVSIERAGEKRGEAETFDLSVWGALILCSSEFEVGDDVYLGMPSPEGKGVRANVLSGDVVRVLEIAPDYGPWSFAIAVEFDEPLEESWVPRFLGRSGEAALR